MPIEIFEGTFEEVKKKYNEFEKGKNNIEKMIPDNKGKLVPAVVSVRSVYATQSHMIGKDHVVLVVYYKDDYEW
jgi:hypothetical protein